MHQNGSIPPVPASAMGATSTGEGPQQLAGVQASKSLPGTFSSAHQSYLSTCLNVKCASRSAISAQAPHQTASTSKRCMPQRRCFLGKTGDKGIEALFGEAQKSSRSQAMPKVSRTGTGFRALPSVSSPAPDTGVVCSLTAMLRPRLHRYFTELWAFPTYS